MSVYVQMFPCAVAVGVNVDLFSREEFAQGIDAEQYQHPADQCFKPRFDRFGDL